MSTLTLRVPDDLDKALERQSAALGISKSDLAREALKRYLRVAEFRTLRTKLVARAQAGGINAARLLTITTGRRGSVDSGHPGRNFSRRSTSGRAGIQQLTLAST